MRDVPERGPTPLLFVILAAILLVCLAGAVATSAEPAPPPRPVPPPDGAPSVLVPDDDAVRGAVAAAPDRPLLAALRAPAANAAVSVLVPDDAAAKEAAAKGALDPANPPMRRVYLGRIAPPVPPKVASLGGGAVAALASPPAVDYGPKAMESLRRQYLNDKYGCCVISSVYHGIGVWTGNDSPTCVVVPDSTILSVYNQLKAGPGDSGCYISDVLDHGVKTGYPLADGKTLAKLDGYAAVDNTNVAQVKAWIHLFGGGPVGVNLPNDWTRGGDGSVWDATTSRSVGGHDVRAFGYDAVGVKVSTWGGTRTITWRAFTDRRLVSEVYCPLSPQWYGPDGAAPPGVRAEALAVALATIRAGGVPDISPPPPPPGPPATGFTGSLNYVNGVLVSVTPGANPPPKVDRAAVDAAVRGVMEAALRDAATGAKALNWSEVIAAVVEALMRLLGA